MKCDTTFKIQRVTRLSEAEILHFVDSIYRARSATDSSSLTKPTQMSQVVLVYILENLAEIDSLVAKHRLSLEFTQSPGGSSDTSKGSKNSGIFEDSGRSNEEYSEDRALMLCEGPSAAHNIKSVAYLADCRALKVTKNMEMKGLKADDRAPLHALTSS
uniref:Uncharacterized protein n=1 Tax=Tanacetum cinerariifolium TaxID=118510 RepID=A0A699HUM7_TANCI|nr:hypothetical protein [Tanacetum cinerariifolium]